MSSIGLVGKAAGIRFRTIGKNRIAKQPKKRWPWIPPVFDFGVHMLGRLLNLRIPKPLTDKERTAKNIQRAIVQGHHRKSGA